MRQARFIGVREDLRAAQKQQEQKSAEAPKLTRVTHASRVVFPADGVTKGQIADYYDAVAPRMAPHLADRPISLLRAPDTIDDLFFQRHPLKGMTRGIIKVPDDEEPYIALDGALGLHTAAQFGAIEIHGWMSLASDLDRPDRMVFDLDPDEDLPFAEVRKAAADLRDYLGEIGLKSWPMVTGGKGVHIVLPLDRSLAYADTEVFAAGLARGLARQEPKRFVANMSKRQRTGRIFIDWLRNKKTATAILPWSLRARPGATVATPLSWKTLASVGSASAFDIRNALDVKDDWRGFFETAQTIAPGGARLHAGAGALNLSDEALLGDVVEEGDDGAGHTAAGCLPEQNAQVETAAAARRARERGDDRGEELAANAAAERAADEIAQRIVALGGRAGRLAAERAGDDLDKNIGNRHETGSRLTSFPVWINSSARALVPFRRQDLRRRRPEPESLPNSPAGGSRASPPRARRRRAR